MKTSLPKALIIGHSRVEEFEIYSTVYNEENLSEKVVIKPTTEDRLIEDFCSFKPDLIITIGSSRENFQVVKEYSANAYISTKWCHYFVEPTDENLANDVATWSTNWACESLNRVFNNSEMPFFSVFTPAYKTEERIWRTYESVKNQTYSNWEWIIIDDSPADHTKTWDILNQIASQDYRVKPYKILPVTGGNIGEAKNRACSMANGNWLIELDHDDYLLPTLMEECCHAIQMHPDAGFLYTDVAEPYEDGEMRAYTQTIGDRSHWYANPENTFVWAYGGHEWIDWNGTSYICHRYPEINPKTIRFNIGMPNHARVWKKEVYDRIGKHNRHISVTDDFELIIRTFLHTRMVHIKQMLYLQYNNRNSTVDNNSIDINRKARLIKDFYDMAIHQRIIDLGGTDWEWNDEEQSSSKFQNDSDRLKYFEEEQPLNYIYEKATTH